MGQKLYTKDESGIRVTSRREGHVRIPNYVYDIWMPLIGSDAVGVYGVYCRLEMQGSVKKITLRDLAACCRIGVSKLNKINAMLEECGFIIVKQPTGHLRLMHYTTEIVVLDPPHSISDALMKSYAVNGEYRSLTPWLTESAETPNGSSGNTKWVLDEAPNGVTKIEDLELNTLIVEIDATTSIADANDDDETAPELVLIAEKPVELFSNGKKRESTKRKKPEPAARQAEMPGMPSLHPESEPERLLFTMLGTEFAAKGRRKPSKFPSMACKTRFLNAAKQLDGGLREAITKTMQMGITAVPNAVAYIEGIANGNARQDATANGRVYFEGNTKVIEL